jgi:uncharacterized protein DUF4203
MQLIIAIVALLIGAAFTLGGWRFFLLLLPIWAFVIGFNVGTDAVSVIFGDGTFATVTSWVVGFILALIFAIFSYLYYYIAVAVLAGAVGYAIGSGAWGMIGNEYGVVAFVIGLVLGVVVAAAALVLNVPKYLVIALTSIGGAATILAGWFILIGKVPSDAIHWTQIGRLITDSWIYLIVFIAIAAAGIVVQTASNLGPDRYQFERNSYRYGSSGTPTTPTTPTAY